MSGKEALARALTHIGTAERAPGLMAGSMHEFRKACQEARWEDAERHRNEGVAALESYFDGVRSAFLEVYRG